MELYWDTQTTMPTVPAVAPAPTRPLAARQRQRRARETQSGSQPLEQGRSACETFCYLASYGVIICKQHATAVQNLDTHLREHHSMLGSTRRQLVQQYKQFSTQRPQDIQLPAPLGPPIPALGAPLRALQCQADECAWITVSLPKLRMHCKEQHGLSWKGDARALYEPVQVQTFFRTGGLQRYFVVAASNADSSQLRASARTNTGPSSAPNAEVARMLVNWQKTQQAHNDKAQVMEAEAPKTDRTGWFKRTGWLEHLARRNTEHLAHQIRLPDQSEDRLQRVVELVERLVEQSVAGLGTLARETRRWLRSAKQSEPDQRPMARLQNPESQARYAGYMARFVCYLLRLLVDQDALPHGRRRGFSNHNPNSSDSNTNTDSNNDDDDNKGSTCGATGVGTCTTSADWMQDARQLFCWQGEQKTLVRELLWALDDSSANETGQIEAVRRVLGSFIFTPVGDDVFSSGLLHFLAVLGIDPALGRLRTAKSYTYMLAGMVYCVRAIGVELLLPAAQRRHQTTEDRRHFLRKRQEFLADGSFSPMSEMLSLLAYGKAVAMAAGNEGSASWSQDKKTFYLNGRPIELRLFCRMAQELVSEAECMLWQQLLWVPGVQDRFQICLEHLVDNVTLARRGASLVNQTDNGSLQGGLQWMLSQALRSCHGQRLRDAAGGAWHIGRVKRYLRLVDRFLELLLICVHVTSGQPGRGSEVTSIRHRNSVLQDRNIFVVDGQVMTVVRYHKSQSQWDKPKVIPRFLPPRLGQVMVMYLAYLQPFQEYLAVEVLGGNFSDYVWADAHGPWTTEQLSRVLRRETGKHLAVELHTLGYRHAAAGIGREVVGSAFSKGFQDEVGEFEGEAEVDEDREEDLVELQSARTTRIGVGNYGVPIDMVKHLSARSLDAFRQLSTQWHRFLGLAAETPACLPLATAQTSSLVTTHHTLSAPAVLPLRNAGAKALQQAMQQVLGLGPDEVAAFRSPQQELALHAVLDRQTPLVVVLPTGGGKSLLFSVPAHLEQGTGGTTVVVVPFRALLHNLVTQLRACKLDCLAWAPGETGTAAIVAVSADVAGDLTGNGNFLGYAAMLSNQGRLRRIVVDECHLIVTSSDWRPKLAQLKNLRLLPCPLVLLTATLPPIREAELGASMLLSGATYIRACTARVSTRYLVSWCGPTQAQEVALAACRRELPELHRKRQRGIVYCRTKAECEDIAAALECPCYHAGIVDLVAQLDVWLKGGGWIVATSALGTGVDYPGVTFIVHVGMPWGLTDYAQESGRGGRKGELVSALIVVSRPEVDRALRQKPDDLEVQAIGMFLVGDGCRRTLMGNYMDGMPVSCSSLESAAACDRCGEGHSVWQQAQREASHAWGMVQEALDSLRGQTCALCWAGFTKAPPNSSWSTHWLIRCPAAPATPGLSPTELDHFRRGIYDGGGTHSCRRCWVSQKFCITGQDASQPCQWPNIVVPLARGVVEQQKGVKIVRECGYQGQLGRGNTSQDWEKEYACWLGKRHAIRVWGEYFSNAIVVAIKVILYVQAKKLAKDL